MASVTIEIADAVANALSTASLSLPFTVTRHYVPIHELRNLKDLTISVVPASVDPKILDRSGHQIYDYLIDVGIQKFIGQGGMTEQEIHAVCDPLMQLAEEIVDLFFFELLPISVDPSPRCIDADQKPIFHPEHLDEKRVFTSLVTLNFRQCR